MYGLNTDQEKEVDAALKAHLRGEWPSEAEMVAAPRLSEWKVVIIQNLFQVRLMILKGVVEGHPRLGSGEQISTSPLLWIDKDRRVARTMSRVYALGNPADDLVNA